MGRTVDELLDTISGEELADWKAFYALQPFGPEHNEWLNGIAASTVANAFRGKGQKAMQPFDFMQEYSRKAQRKDKAARRSSAFDKLMESGALGYTPEDEQAGGSNTWDQQSM